MDVTVLRILKTKALNLQKVIWGLIVTQNMLFDYNFVAYRFIDGEDQLDRSCEK